MPWASVCAIFKSHPLHRHKQAVFSVNKHAADIVGVKEAGYLAHSILGKAQQVKVQLALA